MAIVWHRCKTKVRHLPGPTLPLPFRFRERSHSRTSRSGNPPLHARHRALFQTLLAGATIPLVDQRILYSSTTITFPLFFRTWAMSRSVDLAQIAPTQPKPQNSLPSLHRNVGIPRFTRRPTVPSRGAGQRCDLCTLSSAGVC